MIPFEPFKKSMPKQIIMRIEICKTHSMRIYQQTVLDKA
jgi:hypothetical protein